MRGDAMDLAYQMVNAGLTREALLTLVTDEIMVKHAHHAFTEFVAQQSCWRHGPYAVNKTLHNPYREPRGRWCFLVNRDLTVDLKDVETWLAGQRYIEILETPSMEVPRFVSDEPYVPMANPIKRRIYERHLCRGDIYLYLEREL